MLLLLLKLPNAEAASLPAWSPESLAAATDCAIHGKATSAIETQLDDGTILFDVQLADVSVVGRACGQQPLNTLRLSPEVILEPGTLVGSDLLAFVVFLNGRMYHWGGPAALYRGPGGKAMSGDLLPVVELPCRGPALLARPLSQKVDAPDEHATSPASPHRVFIDDPIALAAPWDDLVARVQSCITNVQRNHETRP